MDTFAMLVVVVVIVIVTVVGSVAAATVVQQLRSRAAMRGMRGRFGPEYERAVLESGDPKRAEQELARREERVRSLDIVGLHPDQVARFGEAWQQVQARFVDAPSAAIEEADRLVTEAMQSRGYPIADLDQRTADISVEHAGVVENYRAATSISLRNRTGAASTEELRQAMIHYRALFDDLLRIQGHGPDHSNG